MGTSLRQILADAAGLDAHSSLVEYGNEQRQLGVDVRDGFWDLVQLGGVLFEPYEDFCAEFCKLDDASNDSDHGEGFRHLPRIPMGLKRRSRSWRGPGRVVWSELRE